jgi:allantoinase
MDTPDRAPLLDERAIENLMPPDGKGLLVHVVLNVESWAFDKPMPRKIIGAPQGVETVPDVANFSWVEYGMRRGLPRIVEALQSRHLPATVSCNAGVFDDYPLTGAGLVETGWEFVGHGLRQESLHRAADERSVITESLQRMAAATGIVPRGWLGPGLNETSETLSILAEEGVSYVLDWAVDDLPLWLSTASRPILAVPYSLELNDSVLFAAHDYPDSEFDRRFDATVERLLRELPSGPRVLALPLHPHLMGVPHRIGQLERALDLLGACDQVVFLTSGQIYDWYVQAEKSHTRTA